MNPLDWKREHQIALVGAFAIGAILGLLFALQMLDTYTGFRWGALWCARRGYDCFYLLNGYWLRATLSACLGGLIGAGIVYIRQLLRA